MGFVTRLLIIIALMGCTSTSWALTANADSNSSKSAVYDYTQDKSYLAKRTAMKSALIPGWGQYANKQYIKIPFIYLALGGATYFIVDNYRNYNTARQAYLYRIDNDPNTEVEKYRFSSDTYIQSEKNLYRQFIDYSVLVAALFYTLNVLDAAVFAHLLDFDVSSDVAIRPSLHIESPSFYSTGSYSPSLGLTVHLK